MAVATLNLRRFVSTSDEFYELCQENPDLQLERTADGEVIILSPADGETGASNLSIGSRLYNWNEEYQLGIAFDSSTGFTLPNGADRSPDAAWIAQERWTVFPMSKSKSFLRLHPILSSNYALLLTAYSHCEKKCKSIWITASVWAG